MKPMPSEQGNNLCIDCGMCCDGSMFANAPVEPGEELSVQSSGLKLTQIDGKAFFRQPCRHFQGGRCAIYQTRFHICRAFRCKLLTAVEQGEIGPQEAREKIDFARALIAQAVRFEPQAASHSQRNVIRVRLAKELAGADNAAAEQSRQSLLSLVAIEAFLDRWFRHKKNLQDDTMRESAPTGSTQS